MPIGILNPKDVTHTTSSRPVATLNGVNQRRWFSDPLNTLMTDQDLNSILGQLRYAYDFYSVPDVEGDDSMLQKAIAAGAGALSGNIAAFQSLIGGADKVPYWTSGSVMSTFLASSYSRSLLSKTSITQWQDALGITASSSPNVIALGGLAGGADFLPYFTGIGTMAQTPFTSYMRTLLDDANAAAAQVTLGLGTMATQSTAGFIAVAGGTMTGTLKFADANFFAGMVGVVPTLQFDIGDSLSYDRTTNVLAIAANGATRLSVSGTAITATLPVTLPADPSLALQAATKQYVDALSTASATAYLPKAGGTMTGALNIDDANFALDTVGGLPTLTLDANDTLAYNRTTNSLIASIGATVRATLTAAALTLTVPVVLPADPASALQAATRQYVDAGDATALLLTGGTMTGALNIDDANFSLDTKVGLPTLTFDSTDYLNYTRASDTLAFAQANVNRLTITPSLITAVGTLTATTLQEGGVNLASKYAALAGAAFTGNVSVAGTLAAPAGSTHGGSVAASRIATFANDGVLTLRFANNGTVIPLVIVNQNVATAGLGHNAGFEFRHGVGELVGPRIASVPTADYASASTASANLYFQYALAGAQVQGLQIGPGVGVGTIALQGAGTFNAATLYENSVALTAKYPQLGVTNTFTAFQVIDIGAAAAPSPALILISSDLANNAAPQLVLRRSSATPSPSDNTGHIRFEANNSALTNFLYADIFMQIADPLAGSEDSKLFFRTTAASSLSAALTLGLGAAFGAASDMGVGTLNAVTLYESGVSLATKYFAAAGVSVYGATLVNDADAATARSTLGLGTAAVQNIGVSGANIPLLSTANTWASAQTIGNTTGSTLLELWAIDTTGSVSPALLTIYKDNTTVGPADQLGEIRMSGRDTVGTKTAYTRILAQAETVTDGAEQGRWQFVNLVAGASTTVGYIGAGWRVGSPSGADKGLGTLNAAVGLYEAGVALNVKYQGLDAMLTSLVGLASVADRLPYFSGVDTFSMATYTAYARTLADDIDAATSRGTLGLGTAAVLNTGTSGNTIPLLNASNSWSGAQIISNATGGSMFNVSATNDTSSGINILFGHARATPTNGDTIATIYFQGNAAPVVNRNYAYMSVAASTVAAGSEASNIQLGTYTAGALATRATIAAGLYMAGATGGDEGVGTINAAAFYEQGVSLATKYATLAGTNGWTSVNTFTAATTFQAVVEVRPSLIIADASAAQNLTLSSDPANSRFIIDIGGTGHSADYLLLGDVSGNNPVNTMGNVSIGALNITPGSRLDVTQGSNITPAAQFIGTANTANAGPVIVLDRNRGVAGVTNDLIAAISIKGRNSANASIEYGRIYGQIIDATAASEDGRIMFQTMTAAGLTNCFYAQAGVVVGNPTSGDKGIGSVNAVAVYDDNVLLTCLPLQEGFLARGEVDLDYWDKLAPNGRHGAAHRFAELLEDGIDPRDPGCYVAAMRAAQALPGMPTFEDWQHGGLSTGEMLSRLWLAVEMLAVAWMSERAVTVH